MRGESSRRRMHRGDPSAVHPHMRGEERSCCHVDSDRAGSPPHAWGRADGHADWMRRTIAVHPHMRGDKRQMLETFAAEAGSPPHAWGELPVAASTRHHHTVHPHMRGEATMVGEMHPARRRFTPTCVGTSATRGPTPASTRGSPPHAWGRRDHVTCRRSRCDGSPPHAWGKLRLLTADRALSGSPPHAWGQAAESDC